MKKKTILILFLIFTSISIFSQSEYNSALIPTKDGAILAFSDSLKSFTLEIKSDKIEPVDQRNFVLIDNWVFQAYNMNFSNPNNLDFAIEKNIKSALSQYIMYEVDYFKKELNYECDSLTFNWGNISNNYFYFWYYNTPDTLETLKKQLYLTTICHNQILNMNIPLEKGTKFSDGKKFLFKIAETLKTNDYPVDFNELYEELNN